MFKDAKHYDVDGRKTLGLQKPGLKFYKGKTYAHWAEKYDVHLNTIKRHMRLHGHLDKVNTPGNRIAPANLKFYKGKRYAHWVQKLNISDATLRAHLKRHGHLDYVHLTLTQLNLVKKLKKDEENSEIFN